MALGSVKNRGSSFRILNTELVLLMPSREKASMSFRFRKILPGITGGPAQKHQEIHQGPGKESPFPVEMDGHGFTVPPFGNFGFPGVQGQGHVGKAGNGDVQGLIDQHLFGGVGQSVLAPDHVGNAVLHIIHGIGEDIERLTVGADNNEIIQICVLFFDGAVHHIVKADGARPLRHPKPNGERKARSLFFRNLFRGKIAAGAVVLVGFFLLSGLFPFGIQFFLCAEAFVGMSRCQKPIRGFPVRINKTGLEIGSFVPVQTQPLQPVQDTVDGVFRGSLKIRIFNAKDEFSAGLPGVQIVENGGARTADMKISGGAGRKPDDNRFVHAAFLLLQAWSMELE